LKLDLQQKPSKHMKALVERLKHDLALKDHQQKALSKALMDLRADMVESAEDRIRVNEARSRVDANVQDLIDAAVEKAIDSAKAEKDALMSELEAARVEVVALKDAGDVAAASEYAIAQKDTEISKLKIQNDQLTSQRSKAKADHDKEISDLRRKLRLAEDKLAMTMPAEKPFVTDPVTEEKKQKAQVAYMQWEGKKQQQVQLEKLKARLQEKEGLCIRLEAKLSTQNTLLQRADKEKLGLENKVKALEGKLRTANAAAKTALIPQNEEERNIHQLRTKNFGLLEKINELQASLNEAEQKDLAIEELKHQNLDLRHRLDYLMKTGKDIGQDGDGVGRAEGDGGRDGGAGDSESGKKTVLNMDNYERVLVVQEALNRESEMQEEILKANKEILELKFLLEQCKQAPVRLRERIQDLEEYNQTLKGEILGLQVKLTAAGAKEAKEPTSARSSASSGVRRIGESGRSNIELEKTILALKKVIEKLEAENTSLKKSPSAVSQQKFKQLSRENEGLKKNMEELRLKVGASLSERYEATQRGKEKIQEENQRLTSESATVKAEADKLKAALATANQRVASLQNNLDEAKKEVEEEKARASASREEAGKGGGWKNAVVSRMYEQKLKDMEEAVAKKDDKVRNLIRENEELKKELANFDPSFFEEIEDLKYNYKESVRRNVQLEEILAKLVQKYNIPIDLTSV